MRCMPRGHPQHREEVVGHPQRPLQLRGLCRRHSGEGRKAVHGEPRQAGARENPSESAECDSLGAFKDKGRAIDTKQRIHETAAGS